jgi:hypothetical protein
LDQNGASVTRAALRKLSGGVTLPALPEAGLWKMMPFTLEVE